jgi:hypothetical protein
LSNIAAAVLSGLFRKKGTFLFREPLKAEQRYY